MPAPVTKTAAAPQAAPPRPGLQLPCLFAGLVIMLAGSLYPPLFAGTDGRADHGLVMALFWAMSAGFVRGVGFVPRHTVPRWLFGGPALGLALAVAALLRVAAPG